jgi:peptide deformylase
MRATLGFGRAAAAPQIGISKHFIALTLNFGSFTIVNPTILERSTETFTMFDDCLCFPDLLVRVRRHKHVSIECEDVFGERHVFQNIETALSELLQHEIDHLDGVLMIDRIDGPKTEALITRAQYRAAPERYDAMVDYVIKPTKPN